MSHGLLFLHSHSALEREMRIPKNTVLVDVKYGHLFLDVPHTPFKCGSKNYYKVNIWSFIKKGGVFKNLSS